MYDEVPQVYRSSPESLKHKEGKPARVYMVEKREEGMSRYNAWKIESKEGYLAKWQK